MIFIVSSNRLQTHLRYSLVCGVASRRLCGLFGLCATYNLWNVTQRSKEMAIGRWWKECFALRKKGTNVKQSHQWRNQETRKKRSKIHWKPSFVHLSCCYSRHRCCCQWCRCEAGRIQKTIKYTNDDSNRLHAFYCFPHSHTHIQILRLPRTVPVCFCFSSFGVCVCLRVVLCFCPSSLLASPAFTGITFLGVVSGKRFSSLSSHPIYVHICTLYSVQCTLYTPTPYKSLYETINKIGNFSLIRFRTCGIKLRNNACKSKTKKKLKNNSICTNKCTIAQPFMCDVSAVAEIESIDVCVWYYICVKRKLHRKPGVCPSALA